MLKSIKLRIRQLKRKKCEIFGHNWILAKRQFSIGSKVVSKLNSEVKEYRMWSDMVQLICDDNGKLVRMLLHNANYI